MSKKTVRKAPGNQSASQRKTKGLIAEGKKTGQSVQNPCVLDNLSHRTPRAPPKAPPKEPQGAYPEPPFSSTAATLPKVPGEGRELKASRGTARC